MAIPSVALTPPSLFSIPSIDPVQGPLFLRQSERSLFSDAGSIFPSSDIVAFSETGQLLSSVAQIADAAEAAEQGATVSTQSIIESAQDFVDSVNAVNLGNDFALSTAIDTSIVPEPATPQADALGAVGISVLPIDSAGDSFVLSLDIETLETAVQSNPAAATEQLAAAAAPIAAAAAVQASATSIVATGSSTRDPFALAAQGTPTAGLLTPQLLAGLAGAGTVIDDTPPLTAVPVVPDLTIENAELRRALADAALSEIVTAVAANTDSLENPVIALPTADSVVAEAALTTPIPIAETVEPDADEPAAVRTLPQSQASTAEPDAVVPPVDANVTTQAALLNAVVAPQAETTLTPSELLTTPLEQITRLAGNPTVAGAVAAFLIPADDGIRTGKGGIQTDLDVINPVAAVRQTEAITASLANGSNDRREDSAESRLDQWRMSPTRFI